MTASLAASIAVNVFIVFLLLVFFLWDLPQDAFARRLLRPFSTPIAYVGLDHEWAMFAPSPPRYNYVPEFELHYADGTHDAFHLDIFGRPDAPGPLSTRHVKFCGALLLPSDSAVKPAFCRYLVREHGRVVAAGETAHEPRVHVGEVRFIGLIRPIAEFSAGRAPHASQERAVLRHTLYQCRFPSPLRRAPAATAG